MLPTYTALPLRDEEALEAIEYGDDLTWPPLNKKEIVEQIKQDGFELVKPVSDAAPNNEPVHLRWTIGPLNAVHVFVHEHFSTITNIDDGNDDPGGEYVGPLMEALTTLESHGLHVWNHPQDQWFDDE